MTTIVGVADQKDGTVWMGSDSQETTAWVSQEMGHSKLFVMNGPTQLLVGVAGSPRVAQILEHHVTLQEHPARISDLAYIIKVAVYLTQQALSDHGILETKDGIADHKSYFMIGYRGKLYTVDGQFSVSHHADNFAAIGSGREFALGALDTALHLGVTPEDAITQVLTTAAKFDLGTSGKMWISRVNKQGDISHE